MVRYLDSTSAAVDIPDSSADALVQSTVPLTDPENGEARPVDFALRREDGAIEAENPSVPVEFPIQADGPASLGTIGVTLDGAAASAPQIEHETAVYPNIEVDSDYLLKAIPNGAEASLQLRSAQSPEHFALALELPEGATATEDPSGKTSILGGDGAEAPPRSRLELAGDANGDRVPAETSLEGNQLVLEVPHRIRDVAYPLIIDPTSPTPQPGVRLVFPRHSIPRTAMAAGMATSPPATTTWTPMPSSISHRWPPSTTITTTFSGTGRRSLWDPDHEPDALQHLALAKFHLLPRPVLHPPQRLPGQLPVDDRRDLQLELLGDRGRFGDNGNYAFVRLLMNGDGWERTMVRLWSLKARSEQLDHARGQRRTDDDDVGFGSAEWVGGSASVTRGSPRPSGVAPRNSSSQAAATAVPRFLPRPASTPAQTGSPTRAQRRRWPRIRRLSGSASDMTVNFASVAEGVNTFSGRAVDLAGFTSNETNWGTAPTTFTVKVDRTAPAFDLAAAQAALGNGQIGQTTSIPITARDPQYDNTGPSAGVTQLDVKVDNATVQTYTQTCPANSCEMTRTWPLDPNQFAEGSHTLTVVATDAGGETKTSPNMPFSVGPPDTAIDSGPSGFTGTNSANFTFSGTHPNSTFQCKLDGGGFASCTSPKAYSSLGDGQHTFEVKATNPAGKTDATPATRTWTVDTMSPNPSISCPPAPSWAQSARTCTVTANDPGSSPSGVASREYQTRVNGGSWSAWTTIAQSGTFSVATEGVTDVQVRATDTVGNISSPASLAVKIDATDPAVSATGTPGRTNLITNPSFEVSVAGWSRSLSATLTRDTSWGSDGSSNGRLVGSVANNELSAYPPTFAFSAGETLQMRATLKVGSGNTATEPARGSACNGMTVPETGFWALRTAPEAHGPRREGQRPSRTPPRPRPGPRGRECGCSATPVEPRPSTCTSTRS